MTINAAQLKRKRGKGLSQEDLIEQDLVLNPAQEKLVAGQVNVLCVCADMKVCVRAWVTEVVTLLTNCAGARLSVQLGSGAGLEKGSVKRTSLSKTWSSVPHKIRSWPGKSMCRVYVLT